VRLKEAAMTFWQRDHAWFAAIAPVEEPEIVVIVLNEHGGHGASEAAPTAAAIIERYFELKRSDASASIAASTSLPAVPLPPRPAMEVKPVRPPAAAPQPDETRTAAQTRPLAQANSVPAGGGP
jgi:penicillin-binding protein 2